MDGASDAQSGIICPCPSYRGWLFFPWLAFNFVGDALLAMY